MSTEAPGIKEVLLQATAQQLRTEALESVRLSKAPEGTSTLPSIPQCITQNSTPRKLKGDPAAIMVGLDPIVPRRKPGSVIKWTAR
ncbi:MAG: hypothetical protein LQ343_002412 [Gyalolechia ehrenbergii]|nr:MAG: hypothetical protein LQ343_002412 [Gyalolechia ehrenbergii]